MEVGGWKVVGAYQDWDGVEVVELVRNFEKGQVKAMVAIHSNETLLDADLIGFEVGGKKYVIETCFGEFVELMELTGGAWE